MHELQKRLSYCLNALRYDPRMVEYELFDQKPVVVQVFCVHLLEYVLGGLNDELHNQDQIL